MRKDVQGPKHPDTITAIANLASAYYSQGRWSEAETLQLEVLKLPQEVLGSKHPDTITAISNLASTYSRQGRLKEAKRKKLEVLKLRQEIQGVKLTDKGLGARMPSLRLNIWRRLFPRQMERDRVNEAGGGESLTGDPGA